MEEEEFSKLCFNIYDKNRWRWSDDKNRSNTEIIEQLFDDARKGDQKVIDQAKIVWFKLYDLQAKQDNTFDTSYKRSIFEEFSEELKKEISSLMRKHTSEFGAPSSFDADDFMNALEQREFHKKFSESVHEREKALKTLSQQFYLAYIHTDRTSKGKGQITIDEGIKRDDKTYYDKLEKEDEKEENDVLKGVLGYFREKSEQRAVYRIRGTYNLPFGKFYCPEYNPIPGLDMVKPFKAEIEGCSQELANVLAGGHSTKEFAFLVFFNNNHGTSNVIHLSIGPEGLGNDQCVDILKLLDKKHMKYTGIDYFSKERCIGFGHTHPGQKIQSPTFSGTDFEFMADFQYRPEAVFANGNITIYLPYFGFVYIERENVKITPVQYEKELHDIEMHDRK